MVAGDFFQTLGVQQALGRRLTKADDRRGWAAIAVLSYEFWQSENAGRAAVLGQGISLDGHPFQIVGVAGRGFGGMSVGQPTSIYVPRCSEAIVRGRNSILDHRSANWLLRVGRPKTGVSAQQVEARLRVLAPEIFRTTAPPESSSEALREYEKRTFETTPAVGGISDLRKRYSNPLMVLMGVVGAVLLIACANVANLLLARVGAAKGDRGPSGAGRGAGRLIASC